MNKVNNEPMIHFIHDARDMKCGSFDDAVEGEHNAVGVEVISSMFSTQCDFFIGKMIQFYSS